MSYHNSSIIRADLSFIDYLNVCDLDYFVKDKLSQNINKIQYGSSDVLTSPIAREKSVEDLLFEFNALFDSKMDLMNSVLLDLELRNKAKFGPRSIAKPWSERKQSLISSFETNNVDTFDSVSRSFSLNRLRPSSVNSALKLLKNSTNSGLPYYTKKGLVKERVLDKFDILVKRQDPCVLFTRTQEQGKTRNVWGFPMADTLNEAKYYFPLLQYQKTLKYRSALISPEEVSRRMTELINKTVMSRDKLLSIDFTSYDSSVKSQLQEDAFNYIKSLFQVSCHHELDYIKHRFNTIGIITPDGLYSGKHGVPSGSTFTNEVDSIVQVNISKRLECINDDCLQVQGDDGVYSVPDSKTNELISLFEDNGLQVSRDKTYLSDNFAIYLQNLYHVDYRNEVGNICGIYPVYRALNRIIYQERWATFEDFEITGKDYYSIRTICILENCKYHPLFKDLVKFVLKNDKYSLDVSHQGLVKYIQMINETKGAGEILNHQYGDNVAGIRSFETFKMIKELS